METGGGAAEEEAGHNLYYVCALLSMLHPVCRFWFVLRCIVLYFVLSCIVLRIVCLSVCKNTKKSNCCAVMWFALLYGKKLLTCVCITKRHDCCHTKRTNTPTQASTHAHIHTHKTLVFGELLLWQPVASGGHVFRYSTRLRSRSRSSRRTGRRSTRRSIRGRRAKVVRASICQTCDGHHQLAKGRQPAAVPEVFPDVRSRQRKRALAPLLRWPGQPLRGRHELVQAGVHAVPLVDEQQGLNFFRLGRGRHAIVTAKDSKEGEGRGAVYDTTAGERSRRRRDRHDERGGEPV